MNGESVPQKIGPAIDSTASIAMLREENARLRRQQQVLFDYIRDKTNQLLDVIGTSPLADEELANISLLESDPIGTVADSFRLILDHLHQTNDRLSLANQEVREIVDAAGAGIMVVDREGCILTLNARVKELFGYAPEMAIGKRCADLICQAGARPPVCALHAIVDEQQPECRVEWNQEERCFEVVGRPIHGEGGNVSHVVIVYADVTQRKRTEEALRQTLNDARDAHARIEGILRSVADGLLVIDLQRNILLMNPTAEKLLGVNVAGLPYPLAQLIPDSGLHMSLDLAHDTLEEKHIDFQLPGSNKIWEGHLSPLLRADGVVAGHIVLLRDVTQARTVERMKSEFVATAAHEFRTPLAAILGFTELLLEPDERSDVERREFLQLVHEKADSLARMVNNLLDISRIESGEELPLDRGPNSLINLIERVLPLFQKSSGSHRFVVEVSPPGILVDVDPDTIEQVLENIIGNAVKYSPAGGTIGVAAHRVDDECRLTVSDQGVGMTSEEAARVFDKFYRADSSNTAVRGTGLGMTIVHHIIEAHGGRIWVESLKGHGTTVSLTLPLAAMDS